MEAKNVLVLEVVKEEKVYRMEVPSNAPLGEAYTAAGSFLDKIVSLINEHVEKRKEIEEKSEAEKDEEK